MANLKILRQGELRSSVAVVVGTRPGIIKMTPVVRGLQKLRVPFFLIHTGQHYSYNMDRQFFEELDLPRPRFHGRGVSKCRLHGEQTAEMIKGVERALLQERPQIIVVGGDANTNFAGAVAGRKLGIGVAHVEAGLRSYDSRMPEEHNRVMIDHISDFLFPPTPSDKANLLRERVRGQIWVTGNTIVDAVREQAELSLWKSRILQDIGLGEGQPYLLLTVHREENVDTQKNLGRITEAISQLFRSFGLPIIFPIHPRTRNRLRLFGLESKLLAVPSVRVIPGVGYLDFLRLLQGTQLVLTDSGGIQEEACCLKIACVTLRDNTERPETVRVGANKIAGLEPADVVKSAHEMLGKQGHWKNPLGDGKAGLRIARVLSKSLR